MGMVIHDDYWEACEQLANDKQRGEFLLAIVRYGMTEVEPLGKPKWLPTFTAFRKRVKLGRSRAKAGSKGGTTTKELTEANDDQTPSKTQANAKQNENLLSCVEGEGEVMRFEDEVEEPYTPFGLLCLDVLNQVMGTCYGTLPSKAALCLSRMDNKYELTDVRRMIEFKRDEWQGTRFANNLTPNTLFSPDHFEQYMHQSKTATKEASEYEQYD